MAQFSFIPAAEAAAFADDIRRLFDELSATLPRERRALSGECRPAVDVLESDEDLEILMDASGIAAAAVRILFRDGVLLVVGEKAPPAGQQGQYHLVEREFGRFARAIRLAGAFDVARGRASIRDGELAIVLPKLVERRGRTHRIPVADAEDRLP